MFCNYDSGYGWLTNQKVVGLNLAIAGLLSTFLSLFLFQLNFTFTTSVLNQLSSLKEVFSKYDVKVEKWMASCAALKAAGLISTKGVKNILPRFSWTNCPSVCCVIFRLGSKNIRLVSNTWANNDANRSGRKMSEKFRLSHHQQKKPFIEISFFCSR